MKDYVEFDHIDIDVKVNGSPLVNGTLPYTDVYKKDDTLIYQFSNFFESSLPSGTYTETLNFFDINGD